MSEFEPKIVCIVCNWCSYGGADSAGNQRRQYSPNIRLVRVMCSGRVEPLFIAKAFQEGADGVMMLGCHPGDCHYQEGNYKAMRRMELLHILLQQFGIPKERFRYEWVSASEGERFANVVTEMYETVKKLGPANLEFSRPTLAAGGK